VRGLELRLYTPQTSVNGILSINAFMFNEVVDMIIGVTPSDEPYKYRKNKMTDLIRKK
jgi:hypothetical protein